jgi:RNA-directed DNA polymerase
MQTKLHRWAGEDPSRRFGDLFNLVYDPAFLVCAWERVSTNKGARTAGIDGVTAAQVEAQIGVEVYLSQIRDLLKSGQFQPVEVRQVMIPKGKTGKFRKLGIPTIADRVVQASVKLVLEPIFEADFKPCSYGFRPNRRAHDAIAEIHHSTSGRNSYLWIFEADIKACFDEISHTALMDRLRKRIKDKRTCALVKAFLKSGILTELRDREETFTGTPQGGILSPLLANIALSALDDHFDRQWHQEMGTPGQRSKRKRHGEASWRLVRYCDDFVLLVAGDRRHAEALREQVTAVLDPLGLRLAPEKTRVVHIDEGFTFLGFDIRRMRKPGTSKHHVYTKPSKKAIQAIKDKVKTATHRSTRHMDLDELITSLNQALTGWANHFRHGASKAVFATVDYHAWSRLMRWTRAKYAGKTGLGMSQMRRRFCDQGWRFAHNGVVFTGASSVAVSRYRYRGNTIATPWTPTPAATVTGG